MKTVIEYLGKKKFAAKVRGHEIRTDVPVEKGGEDTAPTPVELMIAALGTCAGIFAASYLHIAKINAPEMTVEVDWEYASDPERIGKADITVKLPGTELGERERGLIAAVRKCIVHNTLKDPPDVDIKIETT
ncbi:MAG: OsmC family protein [Candidatus Omnitrophota bacterium]